MTTDLDAGVERGTRYEVVRSAAAGTRMVRSIAIRLSIAHDASRALTSRCLCAGCLSTHYYAEAADLAPTGLDDDAAWRQRIADGYHFGHRVARALGWQDPLIDMSSMLAEREEWERSSAGLAALPQRGPLP